MILNITYTLVTVVKLLTRLGIYWCKKTVYEFISVKNIFSQKILS